MPPCEANAVLRCPPVTIDGLSTGCSGVSEIALITTAGSVPAPATSGADSMSTAIAPPAASARVIVPDQPVDGHDRADPARSPARRSSPASSGADGQLTVMVPSRHLRGDHQVAGPQVGGKAAAHAAHCQRFGPGPGDSGRRGGSAGWPVASPDHFHLISTGVVSTAQAAADRTSLDPQRRADCQPAHRMLRRYRPSALTGNTSRYRW